MTKQTPEEIEKICRILQFYSQSNIYLDIPPVVQSGTTKYIYSGFGSYVDKKGLKYGFANEEGINSWALAGIFESLRKRIVKLIQPDGWAPNPILKIGDNPAGYREPGTQRYFWPNNKSTTNLCLQDFRDVSDLIRRKKIELSDRLILTSKEITEMWKDESFRGVNNRGNLAETLFIPNQKGIIRILAQVPEKADSFLITPCNKNYEIDFFDLNNFKINDCTSPSV